MKKTRMMRPALCIAATAIVLCSFASQSAQAKNDPLGSGTTKLVLDKGFLSFLAKNDLRLLAKQGAKRKGTAITLPIAGGTMDLAAGTGEIATEGTLAIAGERGVVLLREITLKTKRTPFIAKVGGSQLKVAMAKKISSHRSGFGSTFKATALTLTAKAATRLQKKLRPSSPFKVGQALGSLRANAQPELITIEDEGSATLTFDAAFVQKLESHFVSLNPIFPAEHVGATFTFPLAAGGELAPSGAIGTLKTAGATEALQLHGAQLFWHEIWLDLGAHQATAEAELLPSPPYPGKTARAAVLGIGSFSVVSEPKQRTISVQGAPLTLTPQGAQELEEAFGEGKGAFAAGEAVGTVGFVAVGE